MTIIEQLCKETHTQSSEWEEVAGHETGVGVEYWFEHCDGDLAYVYDDQGDVSITFPYDDE